MVTPAPDSLSAVRTSTGIDQFDHAISLVDSTRPATPPPDDDGTDPASSRNSTNIAKLPTEEGVPVTRIWSKTGINQEFSKRRYARFQEGKYNKSESSKDARPLGRSGSVLKSIDDRRARVLERLHLRARQAGKAKDVQSHVDILYENQRGLFLFGYPLYSSKSLLNFDPSAWTDINFEDSAVDIRNAQLPDPTWTWAWNRWYADMSDDVDEQGWQYSLMFGRRFSWHGTHPWFHSAVRRRRWLRKRIKIQQTRHEGDPHELTQDYFTIHTKRDASRGTSILSGTLNRSSMYNGRDEPSEVGDEEEDIDNVVSLLHAMKSTTVDRKKLDAFKNFINHGGDELQLLPEVLPELWKLFLYQNSRRQLLSVLEEAEHDIEVSGDPAARSSKAFSDLQSAMKYIRENLGQIEFYSDAKAVEKEYREHEIGHLEVEQPKEDSVGQKTLDQVKRSREPSKDINIELTRVAFKGIPKGAGLNVEPGIGRPNHANSPVSKDS